MTRRDLKPLTIPSRRVALALPSVASSPLAFAAFILPWIGGNAGHGEVEDMQGKVFPINKGDIYVLDQHDKHYLRGGKDEDLILVSIFNPPLKGTERHNLNDPSGSAY